MTSHRKDGRGHWPKGRHLHAVVVPASKLEHALDKLEDFGFRSVAKELGVSDRTVRRWHQRIHRPAPVYQRALISF